MTTGKTGKNNTEIKEEKMCEREKRKKNAEGGMGAWGGGCLWMLSVSRVIYH